MADIIQLLPDSVANQIAAGEVIQRPASVVKELLENSIDAGATSVKLVVKDAGRTLIQVIDNGCGMSETDARMSFERHATSKIKAAADLFALHTKGFRGEALASMAAIAHVDLKTRRHDDELGTQIIMEGAEVISQEPVSTAAGTSFSIKNLFFNVPARRNFLKSNQVEMRHILEEFQRVALTHPEVEMVLLHNDNEVLNLPIGSLRQRVVGIFGKSHNQRLVPVDEATDIVRITGFVSKPEFARKTRGDQYFFVNRRFIKSNYLHHAIRNAFEGLIPSGHHPTYFLYLDIAPDAIDVNIHPTKTEIKFEDERAIYAIIRSAVRQSLGKYNIAPSLDFEQETSFNVSSKEPSELRAPAIHINPDYNPFESEKSTSSTASSTPAPKKESTKGWEEMYQISKDFDQATAAATEVEIEVEETTETTQQVISSNWDEQEKEATATRLTVQLHSRYILTSIKSGFMLLDQHRAHQRILFERLMNAMANQESSSQQQLFPETIELSASDFSLMKEMEEDITALGFDIAEFGKNTYVINGIPADAGDDSPVHLLEALLEQYKLNSDELKIDRREHLARVLSRNMAIKPGKHLGAMEMGQLVDELFGCEIPYYTPAGKPVVVTYTLEELEKRFEQ